MLKSVDDVDVTPPNDPSMVVVVSSMAGSIRFRGVADEKSSSGEAGGMMDVVVAAADATLG